MAEDLTQTGFLLRHRKWNRKYWIAGAFLLILIAVAEWKTYFIEQAVGQYLVWQNQGREKIGRRWQIEKKQLLAGTRLEKISQELRSREKQLISITTFSNLLKKVRQEKQMVIPANHFIRLYENLPSFFKPLIITPDSLIQLQLTGRMENVLFNQSYDEVEILFLAGESRVSKYVALTHSQVEMLLNHGKIVTTNIENDPAYMGRVFSFKAFWELMSAPSFRMQYRDYFMEALPALIEHAKPTTRIGISNKITDDFVEIAIAPDNVRAFIYYIPEEGIMPLLNRLEMNFWQQDENENLLR